MSSAAEVVIYTRPGCHLCEQALAVIEGVRRTEHFELAQVNIESDDELLKRYLERIPVVVINGEEAFQFFVEEQAFLSRVKC